jgi:hypothetical protein
MPYSAASRVRVCREKPVCFRDVVQRLVPVDVPPAELLLCEGLASRVPDLAGCAGLGLGERRSGCRVLGQDDADRVDGCAQDLGHLRHRVGALADELVQASDIYERRVRPGEVEVAEREAR